MIHEFARTVAGGGDGSATRGWQRSVQRSLQRVRRPSPPHHQCIVDALAMRCVLMFCSYFACSSSSFDLKLAKTCRLCGSGTGSRLACRRRGHRRSYREPMRLHIDAAKRQQRKPLSYAFCRMVPNHLRRVDLGKLFRISRSLSILSYALCRMMSKFVA